MKIVRWYDKNPILKEVFEFIQKLDDDSQKEMAKDIIQILMNEFNLNSDECINNISKNYNYKCKRWYDDNIDLYSAFEIIKDLPERVQGEVIKSIIESALLMYFKKDV